MRILLVDDDVALTDILAEQLTQQRYVVDVAADGKSAEEWTGLFSYDFVILDMGLPDVGGISLCQRLRKQEVTSPILMLTAEDSSATKVEALNAGADDYVVKPFDFDELFARIRALRRRDSQVLETVLQQEDLRIDPNTFEVFYQDRALRMTPKEYAMLELFLRHPNQVFSLDAIIDNLWSFEDPPSGDAVRTHIKGLRQKLKAGGAPKDFVETVYGLGYRLKKIQPDPAVKVAGSSKGQSSKGQSSANPSKASDKPALMAAVAAAWERHQDTMQERMDVLQAAATELKAGQLSAELQTAGRSQAHKLAGSMGCFGFAEGSRIARELENLLKLEAPFSQQQGLHFSALVKNLRQHLKQGSSQKVITDAVAHGPQILVVGADEALHQALETEAVAIGMQCQILADYAQATGQFKAQNSTKKKNQSQKDRPLAAALLWVEKDTFGDAVKLLRAIAPQSNEKPILIVTEIQDFNQRLQLVQQGTTVILDKSTDPGHAIEAVQQALKAARKSAKVVAVDDDPQVLELLKTILYPWGFEITVLNGSEQLLTKLASIQPDLLLVDIEMPDANGLEICRVLRADEKWRELPILFLSVHDADTVQHQAFNVGADDFVSKSSMATELPTRITNRLRRTGKTVPVLA